MTEYIFKDYWNKTNSEKITHATEYTKNAGAQAPAFE